MAAVFPANQVIVVGGGLAGMSAANTVVENGGRTPLGTAKVGHVLSPFGSCCIFLTLEISSSLVNIHIKTPALSLDDTRLKKGHSPKSGCPCIICIQQDFVAGQEFLLRWQQHQSDQWHQWSWHQDSEDQVYPWYCWHFCGRYIKGWCQEAGVGQGVVRELCGGCGLVGGQVWPGPLLGGPTGWTLAAPHAPWQGAIPWYDHHLCSWDMLGLKLFALFSTTTWDDNSSASDVRKFLRQN